VESSNLIEPLHGLAVSRPNRAAIVSPRGGLSWKKLDGLVWASALKFHQQGLRAGDRVGVLMVRPLAHLVAALALGRIGVAHVALSIADGESQRQTVRGRLGLRAVIADSTAFKTEAGIVVIGQLPTDSVDSAARDRIRCVDGGAPWLILQSSGTTGDPKFAELTHAQAVQRYRRAQRLFRYREDDVFWAASRLDFVVAKQRTVFSLLAGSAICLPAGLDGFEQVVPFLNASRITLACGTPSHLHALIDHGHALPSIRVFEVRSAVASEPLRQAFRQRVSPHLHVVYATNEGEALSIATPDLQDRFPDTVGVPTHGIDLQIVDSSGAVLGAGQTGEIRVRGQGIVTQYIDQPDATARSFRGGWFHPGDMGYLNAEGALFLQGRKDDMMIFDGMNIYPAEIERVLSAHPAVEDVAAFSWQHDRFQDVPVAAVTLRAPATEDELVAHCKQALGVKYPRRIMLLDELPRNAMGKVLKYQLRETFRSI
jgi:acyl-CoA synthetase (AMP-forming)/AMP-acid ligase II